MLELNGIEAGYEDNVVLRGVDLVVPDNSVVALLGPNGAGKTTLLRVASGLLQPTAGSVWMDGIDVTQWPSHRLAKAGLCHVPGDHGIFPALSVEDNLRLQVPRGDRHMIDVAFRDFPRLAERGMQRAGTLSGGEQQMLALAHAFVSQPEIVLIDEVSMGLAPTVLDEVFAHLGELVNTGTTLLLVEQYVTRALKLADYVYILRKGRTVFAGESAELGQAEIMASYLGEGVA